MSRIITLSVGLLLAIGHTDVALSETAQQNGVALAQGGQGKMTIGAPPQGNSAPTKPPSKRGPQTFYDKYGNELSAEELDPKKETPRYDFAGRKYDTDIEARSRQIFPSISQDSQRNQWVADHEQKGIENEINRSKPLIFPVSR
jgi:hypothetical protein